MASDPRHGPATTLAAPLLVAALLLAGCTGTNAGPAPSDASSTVSVPDPHAPGGVDENGAIEGRVADEELVPVAGATVALYPPTNLSAPLASAQSDADGRFRFETLRPGDYAVGARADGYKDAAPTRVTVTNGPETVTLRLQHLALVSEPYHQTITRKLSFTYQYCYGMPSSAVPTGTPASPGWHCGGASNLPGTFATILENETGVLQSVVTEVFWTDTFAACPAGIRVVVIAPSFNSSSLTETFAKSDAKDPASWTNAPDHVRSPVYLFVPRDGSDPLAMHSADRTQRNGGTPLETSGRWGGVYGFYPVGVLHTPIDVSCSLQQTMDAYQSFFFIDPAPAGWSTLSDR